VKPQWRRQKRQPVTHAFEPGRRYAYCGRAERVSEAEWMFSTAKSACICLACVRVMRYPPEISLAGLIY
jgi:hypothetical protein